MKDRTGKDLTAKDVSGKLLNRVKTIFLEFVLMILRIVGYIPSHHIRLLFYRLAGIKIGRGSRIHIAASFYDSRNIRIGKDSIIGERVVLDGREKLTIGDHVDIASEVMIYNGQHDINDENFNPVFKPVIIEDYVFIGPRSIILPGVTLKKGAVVAAGSVVNKDVEERIVVAGVPAVPVKERQIKEFNYRLGRAAWFR